MVCTMARQANWEEFEETDNFVAHDIENAPKDKESSSVNADRLFKRIEIDDEETLRDKTRSLDDDQLFVVEEVIDYCKKYRRSRVDSNEVPPPLFRKVVVLHKVGPEHPQPTSFSFNVRIQY